MNSPAEFTSVAVKIELYRHAIGTEGEGPYEVKTGGSSAGCVRRASWDGFGRSANPITIGAGGHQCDDPGGVEAERHRSRAAGRRCAFSAAYLSGHCRHDPTRAGGQRFSGG